MLSKITPYWKSIASSILVLYLSFAPPSNFNNIPSLNIPHADKFIHIGMYFILSLCWRMDFLAKNKNSKKKKKFFLVSCLYPIIAGGMIEIMQEYWIFQRSASWSDWGADIIGVLVTTIIVKRPNKVLTNDEQRKIN